MVKIEFSNHAKFKLKERNIDESEVMSVLKTPLTTFLDIETGNMIAIGNRTVKSDHKLIVAYVVRGDIVKVITVIDISKREDIIKKREEKGRWVRIK